MLSNVETATLIALLVLLIVVTIVYYTLPSRGSGPLLLNASGFTPTCSVGVTSGSMPSIDLEPYSVGTADCDQFQCTGMNCCISSEVPPAIL